MTIESRVRRILSLTLNADISDGQDLLRDAEAKWDSLKHVEIIFALEDEFGIQFDEERMATLTSLRNIVVAVEAYHAA